MKKLLFAAAWVWIAHSQARGQISPLFQNLNFSSCTSGYFWTQSNHPSVPPDGSVFAETEPDDASYLLFSMRKADITPEELIVPDFDDLSAQFADLKRIDGATPIAIAEVCYHYLKEEAITNEWVYATPDGLFQDPDQPNIFNSATALVLYIDIKNYRRGPMKFVLKPEHYFTDHNTLPDEIRIDFADGMGWRTITPNVPFTVNYSGQSDEKHIRLEITRNSTISRSGLKTLAIECVSEYDDPDPNVPWTTTGNPELPWEISTVFDGTLVRGNAYYLPTGEFDKPFIFVEGIDFDYTVTAEKNGDFGWCELTSGMDEDDYPYAMLHKMPELLDAIRANGYDIILLDFRDGATWIEDNSALLRQLIEMVNEVKTGNHQNVLAGASMGGQITRHALRMMELSGQNHCTKIWISLDSPHTGAYIPIALQQTIEALSEHNDDAMDFKVDYLTRPAAKQLLNLQYIDASNSGEIYSPPLRNAWYQTLDEIGYPKDSWNIGIANGNMNGAPNHTDLNEPLLNSSCELHPLLAGPEARFYLLPSSGDPYYYDDLGFQSNPNQDVSAQVVITVKENPSVLGALLNLTGAELSKHIYTYWVNANTPNYDYAPGGTRTSMRDLVRSANKKLRKEGCADINYYIKEHCFIPTASALGIPVNDPYTNINQQISSNPETCPFDSFIGSEAGNQAHSEITDLNMIHILDEILGMESFGGASVLPEVFTSQYELGSSFNFGGNSPHIIPSVTVEQGARININHTGPINFGTSDDPESIEGLFQVQTQNGCSSSIIKIRNFGILELGTNNSLWSGQLTIGRNASLRLEAGGLAIINPGSKLVIEDGGLLVVESGSILDNRGDIIVQAGGRIIYKGGVWKLSGTASRLVLDGGQLHIDPGVTLAFTHDGSFGHVEFTGAADHDLFLGQGAVMRITGTSSDDVILIARDWANAWNGNFGLGHLVLENGTVDLSNNGQLWLDMKLTATNCIFRDLSPLAGSSTIQPWYTTATLKDCTLEKVLFKANSSRCYIAGCTFNDALTGAQMTGGFYRVRTSDFTDCSVKSSALQNPSVIEGCTFTTSENANPIDFAITDESLTRITVSNTLIDYSGIGISKRGGSLVMSCNTIVNSDIAVLATKGCMLHMDSQNNAGYNYFGGNDEHISLDNAGALSLSKGYNHFGPFYSMNISGTIAGVACPDDCSAPELDATANVWSADGSVAQPDMNFISLYSGSFSMPCSSPPAYFYCPIELVDENPAVPATCQQFKDPIELRKPQKSATVAGGSAPQKEGQTGPAGSLRNGEEDPGNPLIYTSSFNGMALDDALIFAAEQVETYDSTANDLGAVQLFHEILTSDLDRTHPEIRWKMIWGRDQMKGAFEHLVLDGEILPELNAESFTPPVQQFVDVLNLMTDSVLTDSTYRSQFYLELDKGQFFRTLGRNDIALQVFTHLGDCQVDSLEQAVLNRWRLQSELEMDIQNQYTDLGLPPNAISASADTSAYVIPVSYVSDAYYFGLHIYSPEELSFVGCDEQFGWKNTGENGSGNLSVFPNPATDQIQLQSTGPDGAAIVQWIDAAGRVAWTSSVQLSPYQPCTLALPDTLCAGLYQLRVQTATGSYPLRLVIH
ncbi:MAG: hypothetical protein ACK500_03175 [Flavobacteriales bacterium]